MAGSRAVLGGTPGSARAWADGLAEHPDGLWPRFDPDVLIEALRPVAEVQHWAAWNAVACPTLLVLRGSGSIDATEIAAMVNRHPDTKHWRFCITARNEKALDEGVQALGGPRYAIGVTGKADNIEHQANAVRRTIDTFGRLDFLLNNTGINPVYGGLIDLDLNAARKIFEVNYLAALSWAQQVHRAWMGKHGGAVVNVSSVAGLKPAPGIGFYGATKAMLGHITQELAVELGSRIRVNAVAPAVVKTRFAAALYEGREEQVAAQYPLKRLGLPEDISGVVAFLLSDEAAWLTGQIVIVDGGLTLTGGL